jgi:ABC-type transport system involved in cytochrome bd biosynthesis fused ATPase/permease subunit
MTTIVKEEFTLHLQDFGLEVAKRTLLSGVNLRLAAQGLTVVFGRSGTGKTTLLKAMSLLVPVRGTVRLTGKSGRPPSPEEFRSQVQYVHQEPWLFPGTVRENLLLPTSLKHHRHREVGEKVLIAHFQGLGLSRSLLDQDTAELSGGEKQRVAIIRSLLLHPRFLLLDEPTSAMDLATEEKTLNRLGELKSELGVIAVTHSAEVIAAADRVLLLANGALTEITEKLDRESIKRMVEDG